ncbi:acyl CoA:acetate/3-ketoacid CoA transferase [Acetobacteraceae bacterium H6797]|nr:acyl CoA:acetate/3-ketoacid CoA transferase [Acetobacteraceae bacterium H6797]
MAARAPKIITATEAAALIKDDDFVIIGGNGGTGTAEAIIEAIERRFLAEKTPQALTLFHITGVGATTEHGMCHFAHAGLVKRVFGGHYGLQVPFMALIDGNQIEAYNFPQGVMTSLCRAMAGGQPGVLTHVGLETYMDPRLGGGRMNPRTTEEFVEVVNLLDKEWLFYRSPGAPRVAILRGTTADEDGYISMEHEATTREDISIAQAVHKAGGIVICQVKRLAKRGSLHPQMVKIPGFLVDYVVLEPEQMQTFGTRFDPSRCGETRVPTSAIIPDMMSERRIMARRAAMELRPGDVVNLGVGVSAMIPNVAAEEGIEDLITLTVEAGVIGGVPGHAREFGTAINPRAIIDQGYQFDFYDGGGLNCAFLSFAQVDEEGNVNVTRFGNRFAGAGGFIDITQNTRRLVFSGTLTGQGLDIDISDQGIKIKREGRLQKFLPEVEQVSFSAHLARQKGQEVTFVTERAVFDLAPEGLVLTEIAPGIRLEEDVLSQMGFRPKVSPNLIEMDKRLFRKGPMGIKPAFEQLQPRARSRA